ncbi:putative membrane protein [Oopsacas minuta]|uniref:Membrane protein n=1 Tax=Oopsacas minuta TaxID=111878 RepID=A0AAV7JJI1_9METZ|nr:putative membrane protein [Oopsacas minuta]
MRFTLKDICKYFNVPHATFALSFLAFSFLLALYLDGILQISIWVVFIPLWIWDIATLLGIIFTLTLWHTKYHSRCQDDTAKHYFHSILPSMFTMLLLISFELLVCINLSLSLPIYFVVTCMPLFIISIFSIFSILCTLGTKRVFVVYYDIHLVLSWLQVLFLGLRVDTIVTWHWANTFIPSWLLLVVDIFLYITLVLIIYKIRIGRIGEHRAKTRIKVQFWSFTILFPFFHILTTAFLILLVIKLETADNLYFSILFIPLYLILLLLILCSAVVNRSNPLWFGLRTSFFEGLIKFCPIFQDLVNISYSTSAPNEDRESLHVPNNGHNQDTHDPAIVPYKDILSPD